MALARPTALPGAEEQKDSTGKVSAAVLQRTSKPIGTTHEQKPVTTVTATISASPNHLGMKRPTRRSGEELHTIEPSAANVYELWLVLMMSVNKRRPHART